MRRRGSGRGFTLIELLGVILIIGLLIGFVIVAAQGAQRDAQRENTRSLIVKLDNAMNQLMDAVQSTRVEPTAIHINWATTFHMVNGNPVGNVDRGTRMRAQVLATYDEIRAQVPDVFFVNVPDPSNNFDPVNYPYPIDFAQQPWPSGYQGHWDYALPLGLNYANFVNNEPKSPGTGMHGASYGAAAGLLKNLGNVTSEYTPNPQQVAAQGADGVDNDSDTFIDNIAEGMGGISNVNPVISASVKVSLTQHKHATARSEMLYALLVEGQSQFGAFLSKDDFTSGQIGDTDHDGLPEFLDAWGNPLQFYRWPTMYHSDVQKGVWANTAMSPCNSSDPPGPYAGVFETREQDPYDPNQMLMAPIWWPNRTSLPMPEFSWQFLPSGPNGLLSGGTMTFQRFFHWLVEPLDSGSPSSCMFWDRSGAGATPPLHPRRAFYTRFLILSGGPDGIPGVPVLDDQIIRSYVTAGNPAAASLALQLESAAAQYDLSPMLQNPTNSTVTFFGGTSPSNADPANFGSNYFDEGLDDITNHNLNSTAQSSAQ